MSGSARRSSAGNGGKRVPLGAGGPLETKLEWTGRVVSWSTGVYLRHAGRQCDAARTAPVPPPCRRYWSGTYRRWRAPGGEACSGTSVRAVDRLSGGRRYLGVVSAWCAVVVRRVPISRAPPRRAGGAVRSSLTAAASTQQPPGAGGGCPPACAAIRLVRRCSLEMEMPEPQGGAPGALVHCHQQKDY